MVVMQRLVLTERHLFLMRTRDLATALDELESSLIENSPRAALELAARHDPELAALLLELAEANARALNRIASLLEQPRDAAQVSATLSEMRAGADVLLDLRGAQQ